MTPSSSSLRFVLMGEQSLLIRCGTLLLNRGHEITGLVADNDQIQKWARDNALPCWSPTADYAEALKETAFDYFFSIANLRIVPSSVLQLPEKGAINFHDGPLPERAGMHVPSWSIIEQHSEHGVAWHRMTEDVDAGDILAHNRFPIAPDETAFTLNTKCYEAGIASFSELIQALESNTLSPLTQDLSQQTYYAWHKRPAHAGLLDWTQPAASLDALVRGLTFNVGPNLLVTPKLRIGSVAYRVGQLTILSESSVDAPGTLVEATPDRLVVATSTQNVAVSSLQTLQGAPLALHTLVQEHSLSAGDRLPLPDGEFGQRLDALQSEAVPHESYWRTQLRKRTPLNLPYITPSRDPAAPARAAQSLPSSLLASTDSPRQNTATAWIGFLARLTQSNSFTVGLQHPALSTAVDGLESLYARRVPWTIEIDRDAPVQDALQQIEDALSAKISHLTYAEDLIARIPALKDQPSPSVNLVLSDASDETNSVLPDESALSLQVEPDGSLTWIYDSSRLSRNDLDRLQAQFARFAETAQATPDQPLCTIPILDEDEIRTLLDTWNDTERPYDPTPIHRQFENQVERTPEAVALSFGPASWTYRDLDRRANRIARRLIDRGVSPGDRVGVCVERSLDMVASLYGIWKAGAAYVPLDPAYPSDRIAFMVSDAEVTCVISQTRFASLLLSTDGEILYLDEEASTLDACSPEAVDRPDDPNAVAYVIYTSGSTGKPKGVMVTHRNVANFFVGMDERIPRRADGQDVWLAVTSISFDISVLELFWTLSRGFKVVLQSGDRTHAAQNGSAAPPTLDRPVSFSLFYFSSDEKLDGAEGEASDKYRLLLEGAEYGDNNGFEAIWTPERHFHDFGGLYPNPSVISAAIAARTNKIGIRAGSCVSPLHHSVRIAEDWAIVDNLSNGRVGISFAAGWQPNDFVIQPQNFADRKALMFDQIEEVKALWRGEERTFDGPTGPVTLRTLPRPVQSDLPVWVTAAGNPETFEQAGAGGYHLLTHLLGQSVTDLAEKVSLYRRAWREAGHPGEGTVSLMLHTFVGPDASEVQKVVREPMKSYLRSSIGLIKEAAWSFPTFKQKTTSADGAFSLDALTAEETDAVLEHAFERYYATSGLFGTPNQCLERVAEVTAAGVDEIACLLDFGINAQTVLDHLPFLTEVKDRADRLSNASAPSSIGDGTPGTATPALQDDSIPAQIQRHGVTHLQCTPSQARMLVADADTRTALGALHHMMVGGEAFPPALARELTTLVGGTVSNMYGPTETTIWSSTWTVQDMNGSVPIGTPIANTSLYVLDEAQQLVPMGLPGELWIGGDGVTDGYLDRPALTAERFIENPFDEGRLYRTGDRVQYTPDGTLEYLGRTDFQVKIRGHRIELGEIEAALERQDGVRAAVAHVHTSNDSDQRLVAYLQPEDGHSLDPEAVRHGVAHTLPAIMVPSLITTIESFPLTPNGKVDRKALPDPTPTRAVQTDSFEAPTDATEELVSRIWKQVLDLERVGVTENFFDLGGHSLLAVKMVRLLSDELGREIPIVELFQYPTIRSLANHLGTDATAPEGATRGTSRAERRRQAFARR